MPVSPLLTGEYVTAVNPDLEDSSGDAIMEDLSEE
jgi:hypothetical protein